LAGEHASGHGRGFPLAPAPFGGCPNTCRPPYHKEGDSEGFQRASGKTRSVSSAHKALPCLVLVKPPTFGSLSPSVKCPQDTHFPSVPLVHPQVHSPVKQKAPPPKRRRSLVPKGVRGRRNAPEISLHDYCLLLNQCACSMAKSRCVTLTCLPCAFSCSQRYSAMATLRCAPPVQPMAITSRCLPSVT